MKQVAKLVIIDKNGHHLLMYRSNHPVFGEDPDLPGGTLEEGEAPLQAVLREVMEEIGVMVSAGAVTEVYSGTDYSGHGTHYSLFTTNVDEQPRITMSWEHSSYEWLPLNEFLEKAKTPTTPICIWCTTLCLSSALRVRSL